ncbi:MAG: alpha-L-rhamnosidase N-terminal domain-containing protein, partial [Ferruginibacter sp.]|nr:alpha-L-rhamnosidase N-terminal domain-containing protein [Ferruginibacter sp.]
MQKSIIFFFCLFFYRLLFAQQISVANLQCEYQQMPLGVEAEHPQFSWQLFSAKRNVLQSAYRILVSDDSMLLQKNIGNVWDTKKVISNQSIQVNYNGKKLLATHTYYWKAMVWDNLKDTSAWCTAASWQMGLLTKQDWKNALWIAYKKLPDSLRIVPGIHGDGDSSLGAGKDILPLFRKDFTLTKQLKKATAFVAGLGHFDLRLNGKKVGDHFLDAGWTQYDKHALYVTFDITSQLLQGNNALGVMLGNGFYYTPRERYRKITVAYGYPKMICLVKLEYEDGSSENIVSDPSWKTAPG